MEASHLANAVSSERPAFREEEASSKPRRLSEEIAALIAAFAERSVTLRELTEVLRGRAYTLLLILLAVRCREFPRLLVW